MRLNRGSTTPGVEAAPTPEAGRWPSLAARPKGFGCCTPRRVNLATGQRPRRQGVNEQGGGSSFFPPSFLVCRGRLLRKKTVSYLPLAQPGEPPPYIYISPSLFFWGTTMLVGSSDLTEKKKPSQKTSTVQKKKIIIIYTSSDSYYSSLIWIYLSLKYV
jgi:hypothetical protein